MKTIAITIDEHTLELLDRLARDRKDGRRVNRSELARTALREFAERELRTRAEEAESAVLRKNRTRLQRQATALIREQAKS